MLILRSCLHTQLCIVVQGHRRQSSAAARRQHTGGHSAQARGQQRGPGAGNHPAAGEERGSASQSAPDLARRDAHAAAAKAHGGQEPKPAAAMHPSHAVQSEPSTNSRTFSADEEAAGLTADAASPQQTSVSETAGSGQHQHAAKQQRNLRLSDVAGSSAAAAEAASGEPAPVPAESAPAAAPASQVAEQQGLVVASPSSQRPATSDAAADATQQPSADQRSADNAGLVNSHNAGSTLHEAHVQRPSPSSEITADSAQRSHASGHAIAEQPLEDRVDAEQQLAATTEAGEESLAVSVDLLAEEHTASAVSGSEPAMAPAEPDVADGGSDWRAGGASAS